MLEGMLLLSLNYLLLLQCCFKKWFYFLYWAAASQEQAGMCSCACVLIQFCRISWICETLWKTLEDERL